MKTLFTCLSLLNTFLPPVPTLPPSSFCTRVADGNYATSTLLPARESSPRVMTSLHETSVYVTSQQDGLRDVLTLQLLATFIRNPGRSGRDVY